MTAGNGRTNDQVLVDFCKMISSQMRFTRKRAVVHDLLCELDFGTDGISMADRDLTDHPIRALLAVGLGVSALVAVISATTAWSALVFFRHHIHGDFSQVADLIGAIAALTLVPLTWRFIEGALGRQYYFIFRPSDATWISPWFVVPWTLLVVAAMECTDRLVTSRVVHSLGSPHLVHKLGSYATAPPPPYGISLSVESVFLVLLVGAMWLRLYTIMNLVRLADDSHEILASGGSETALNGFVDDANETLEGLNERAAAQMGKHSGTSPGWISVKPSTAPPPPPPPPPPP